MAELENFPFPLDATGAVGYRLEVTFLGEYQALKGLLITYFGVCMSNILDEHSGVMVQSVSQGIEAD